MTIENQFAQGDILITKISELPEEVSEMEKEKENYVLAHSETGHHHVIDSQHAKAYRSGNPFIMFVVVKKKTQITHMRAFDTHEPIKMDVGVYEIRRQREYTPEGLRVVAD